MTSTYGKGHVIEVNGAACAPPRNDLGFFWDATANASVLGQPSPTTLARLLWITSYPLTINAALMVGWVCPKLIKLIRGHQSFCGLSALMPTRMLESQSIVYVLRSCTFVYFFKTYIFLILGAYIEPTSCRFPSSFVSHPIRSPRALQCLWQLRKGKTLRRAVVFPPHSVKDPILLGTDRLL